MTQTTKLDQQVQAIYSHCRERAAVLNPPYWLIGDDESLSYCWSCLQAHLPPDAEVGLDWGGGYCYEGDGPEVCEDCGELLAYELTSYGSTEELAHFAQYPPDLTNPEVCYAFAAIADAVYSDHEKRLLVNIFKMAQRAQRQAK